MANMSVEEIKERNKQYIGNLAKNKLQYLNFLSVMSKNYRRDLDFISCFAQDAPPSTSVATIMDGWAKYAKGMAKNDTVSVVPVANAVSFDVIKNGNVVKCYDISQVVAKVNGNPFTLSYNYSFPYKDDKHNHLLQDVVATDESTEVKVRKIIKSVVNKTNYSDSDKELIALSATSVALEKMGFSTDDISSEIMSVSFKDKDFYKISEEVYNMANKFISTLELAVKNDAIENDIDYVNALLDEYGVIEEVLQKISQDTQKNNSENDSASDEKTNAEKISQAEEVAPITEDNQNNSIKTDVVTENDSASDEKTNAEKISQAEEVAPITDQNNSIKTDVVTENDSASDEKTNAEEFSQIEEVAPVTKDNQNNSDKADVVTEETKAFEEIQQKINKFLADNTDTPEDYSDSETFGKMETALGRFKKNYPDSSKIDELQKILDEYIENKAQHILNNLNLTDFLLKQIVSLEILDNSATLEQKNPKFPNDIFDRITPSVQKLGGTFTLDEKASQRGTFDFSASNYGAKIFSKVIDKIKEKKK